MPHALPLTFVADLADGLAGRLLDVAPTFDGHALALVASPEDAARATARVESAGGATFPVSLVDPPYPALVVEHDGRDAVRTVELPAVPVAFPFVQSLPDGDVLVVGSRCRRHSDGTAERNACVYDAAGELRRTFTAGDGIAHVRTTPSGSVWVAYFDEGVFGNLGWDDPVGRSGIVVFDAAGRITWRFEPRRGLSDIADCYALNVDGEEAWACYYTDFPVVRIAGGHLTSWANPFEAVYALAVDGDRILLAGGYAARDRVVLATLRPGPPASPLDGSVKRVREYVLRPPDGGPLRDLTVIGRGGTLHVFSGSAWYRVRLAEL